MAGPPYLFHLKQGETQPAAMGGTKYRTLCGLWVFDCIASDVDCANRWVTCPTCSKHDPHPKNQIDPAPTWA